MEFAKDAEFADIMFVPSLYFDKFNSLDEDSYEYNYPEGFDDFQNKYEVINSMENCWSISTTCLSLEELQNELEQYLFLIYNKDFVQFLDECED